MFGTSSNGGKRAVAELCKAYSRRHKSSLVPVVALESSSYVHPNKALGRVKVPVFKIVGWVEGPGAGAPPALSPRSPAPALASPRGFTPASAVAPLIDDDIPFMCEWR
jgi:hypothetical protein